MKNDRDQPRSDAKLLDHRRLSLLEPTEQYVALIDLLGWANYVKDDFKKAVDLYDRMLKHAVDLYDAILKSWVKEKEYTRVVSMRVFSDSILLVSPELVPIITTAYAVQHAALFNDCVVRGGIARGKHIELGSQAELYVVSEALVNAAIIEKQVKKPFIVLDPQIVPPTPAAELRAFHPVRRIVIFFEGLWIVNPFTPYWGASALMRVTQLKKRYPEHSDKYDCFLRLYDAIASEAPLVPDDSR